MRLKNVKKYLIRIALIAALIFILWQVATITKPLEYGALSIARVLWVGGSYVGEYASSVRVFFQSKQSLFEENNKLQSTLKIAGIKMLVYEDLKRENQELKKILGREGGTDGVLGTILSQPNNSPYDTFLIDIGVKHGVVVGSHVVYENVLLGVIDSTALRTSKVRLFSSPGTETNVLVGVERTPTVANGIGGGVFEIKTPRDISIEEGDIVAYPALKNYVLGVVARVISKPASSFQTIHFRAPINIFTIQHIVVVPAVDF